MLYHRRTNCTWANLLLEYPNVLVYLLFLETKFISSVSTNPTWCIYTREKKKDKLLSYEWEKKLNTMQGSTKISTSIHTLLLNLDHVWFIVSNIFKCLLMGKHKRYNRKTWGIATFNTSEQTCTVFGHLLQRYTTRAILFLGNACVSRNWQGHESSENFNNYTTFTCMHVCMQKHTRAIALTMEFTLIIRLGEPLIRDGRSNIESSAGARWFTCMCSSCPSFENLCGSKQTTKKHQAN